MLLDSKVVLVTGAASPRGIGKATAKVLAAQGARVVILDLRKEDAVEAVDPAAELDAHRRLDDLVHHARPPEDQDQA